MKVIRKQKIESLIETKANAEHQKEIEFELNTQSEEKTVASLLENHKNKEDEIETTGKRD